MSWNGYRMSRDMWGNVKHEHIHTGWTVTFAMDGKTWTWKLGARYATKSDVEFKVFSKYPSATNIRCNKHVCEV
jgi:hypothetical protein